MATHVTDYKKVSKQIALDLINHDNGTSFTEDQVDLQVDQQASSDERLTTVDVAARLGSGYAGALKVTYNRVGLEQIPEISEITDSAVEHDVVRVSDILGVINTRFGVNIQSDDVHVEALFPGDLIFSGDDEVPELAFDEYASYDIRALTSSLVWQGNLALQITRVRQSLKSIWQVDVLNGLNAPEAISFPWPADPVMADESGAVRTRPDGSIKIFAVAAG